MDRLEDSVDRGVIEVGQWRVGTHPARVRSEVVVAEPLVVAGRRQCDRGRAVADRDDARLATGQSLLDHEGRLARRPAGEK